MWVYSRAFFYFGLRAPGHSQAGVAVPYRHQRLNDSTLTGQGTSDEVKRAGLDKFRQSVRDISPFLGGRLNEIDVWDKVQLLTVEVDRLQRWYRPGLICIGDAAHAMSPIGQIRRLV